jgi:HAD superfamily hydrolase (TIGR01549 family)
LLKFDAIVFDFDGVLVESVDVKTRAFAELFCAYGPEAVERILAFHDANGGISRYAKFRFFFEQVIKQPLNGNEERELDVQFSRLVEDKVVKASWVAGAKEFLDQWHEQIPLYVSSGMPNDELKRIVIRRNMEHYFRCIQGSPASKAEILRSVADQLNVAPSRVLMIGDAMADLEGARQAGTAFLARARPDRHNLFVSSEVPAIPDLKELANWITV